MPVPASDGDPGAEQGRREVGDDPVDQPGPQERAGQRRAALEQHQPAAPARAGPAAARSRSTRPSGPVPSSAAVATQVGAESSQHPRAGRRTARGVDDHPQRLLAGQSRRSASRTVSCGSSASTVPTPATIVSHSARSRCASARDSGRGDPAAGPVGGGDPAVQGRGDLPDHERAAQPYAGQPALVGPLGLRRRAGPPRRRPRPRAAARPRRPPARVGSATAKTTRATPAASSASVHGPVRPVCAQGSRVTTTVPPRGPVTGLGQRDDLGVRPAGPLVPALADHLAVPVEDDGADVRVGMGRLADRARTARRRGASPRPRARLATRCSLARARSGGPPGSRRAGADVSPGAHGLRRRRAPGVLPPIRTFTVGPGVPPGQPAGSQPCGCVPDRVADCHRRFGISPTPEHAVRSYLSRPVCHARASWHAGGTAGPTGAAASGDVARPEDRSTR